MLRPARKFLAYLMVAATVLAGSLNGYLPFAGHQDTTASLAHALGGMHDHHEDDHGHGNATSVVLDIDGHDTHGGASGANCPHQGQSEHGCPHAHVQCCSSLAAALCTSGPTIFGQGQEARFELTSTLPAGNIFYPLLRPPRALA